nr:MAG TPA: hypothetical protein [Caudoviricetes sp.]DAY68780.1 MAG TPA: hypothetical protein [Caudoviricetes sp.]
MFIFRNVRFLFLYRSGIFIIYTSVITCTELTIISSIYY